MDERLATYYLSSFCLFGIWAYLGIHGLKSGRVRDYSAFYGFTLATAASVLFRLIATHLLGGESRLYATIYFASGLPAHGFLLYLLWAIYRRAGGSWKGGWLVLVLPLYYLVQSLAIESSLIEYRLSNSLLCLEVSLGAAAYLSLIRNSAFCLGRNLGGILAGIFLPALYSWSNHVAYLFQAKWWPINFFSTFDEVVYILGWLLMAWAVREYDPPREIAEEVLDQESIKRRLASAVQTVKGL